MTYNVFGGTLKLAQLQILGLKQHQEPYLLYCNWKLLSTVNRYADQEAYYMFRE